MTDGKSTRTATSQAAETRSPELPRGSCFLSDRMSVTEEEWQSLLEQAKELAQRAELDDESGR
ncbi:hypothetical protein [Rhizobium etli]|nr:hypothetical protein [Rhizobium etli]